MSEVKFDEFNLETEMFSLEHLLDSEENLELIEKFSAPNNATGLENFVMRNGDSCSVKETHPLFQLVGILSHEEAQEIRSEKMSFSGA